VAEASKEGEAPPVSKEISDASKTAKPVPVSKEMAEAIEKAMLDAAQKTKEKVPD
jgi:hypothetical protein